MQPGTKANVLLWLTLALSAQFGQFGAGSNILGLFPHHGYSHFKVFYPIMRGLAERGHNVTVVTYIKSSETHPNYNELLLGGMSTVNDFDLGDYSPSRSLSVLLGEYWALHREGQESCKIFYESGHVETLLEQHKLLPFDLVVMEYFNTDCYLAVPHLMQLPVVGLSSCALMPWYYDRILLPDTPSHVQSEFVGFPAELDWQQRLVNFVQAKVNKWLYRYNTNYHDNKLIKKYLALDLNVAEIAESITSLIFVNQHYSLGGNRPLPTQLIEMGGVHVDERHARAPLPKEMADFLQKAPTGVLFISWGSNVLASSLPAPKLAVMLKLLQRLPYKVIWKWESDEPPIKSEQFLFTKWAPQFSLLCHPQVKVFWGHGGLLGTTEALYCGKPLIVTPIYGDQFLNAHGVENRKIGMIMHYNDINEERLGNVLQQIISESYAERAQSLSLIFRNRQNSPLQTTLWWIEHLLTHGELANEVLRTPAVHMNWFVYHSLDSVALLLLGAVLLVALLRFPIGVLCMAMRKPRNKIKRN